MPDSSETRWMTVDEVAAYLKLGRTKVYQLVQDGTLPAAKVGGQWRFDRTLVDHWLERRLQTRLGESSLPPDWIRNILLPEHVCFLDVQSKKEALDALIDRMAALDGMPARAAIAEAVFHREELMSTGIGLGIGVPHIRLASVPRLAMVVGVCRKPLEDYESIDGEPVWLIFMIVAGLDQQADYLRLLAKLSGALKDDGLRKRLRAAPTPEEFFAVLAAALS